MIDRESQYAYVNGARLELPATLAAFALLAATTLFATQAKAAPAPKVEICHIPPGNPSNFHTIKVSENALSAHLDHGDAVGPCNDVCAFLCDDGNACTIDDFGDCESEGCPPAPRAEVDCTDGNQCTQDDCEPATGCVNTILEGEACDDDALCTANDVCDEVGACTGTPIDNCCIGDVDCNPTFCNGNFCGMDNRCDSAPPCVPDDIACTEPFCNEDELMCGETPVDVLCEDQIDCTVGSCDPESGCVHEPVNELCPPRDVCQPLVGCDPELDCVYDQIPDCCNSDADCPSGQVCNDTGGIPQCEPAEPSCFTASDYIGSGDTGGLRLDCEQNGSCAEPRQCSRGGSLEFDCVVRGDPSACDHLDAFYASTGGCNICEPPEPQPSECPCWDGGPQSVFGITNLTELWQTYGPSTCVTDVCTDSSLESNGIIAITTRAECFWPGINDMSTGVVSNTNQELTQCSVFVRSPAIDVRVTLPIGSAEAAACLAEHDAFTATIAIPPAPPGGTNLANPCFLAGL